MHQIHLKSLASPKTGKELEIHDDFFCSELFFTFDFFSLQFGFGNNNGDFSETVLSDIFFKNTQFFAQKSRTVSFPPRNN